MAEVKIEDLVKEIATLKAEVATLRSEVESHVDLYNKHIMGCHAG
jgi:hypothetical protein